MYLYVCVYAENYLCSRRRDALFVNSPGFDPTARCRQDSNPAACLLYLLWKISLGEAEKTRQDNAGKKAELDGEIPP